MFTTKYRPNNITDFIGNKQIIQPFIKWLLEWKPENIKNKCALVSGACGIGKSLIVELIMKKHDYNIINITTDDERNKDYMNKIIKPIIKSKKTFDLQENVLVISDIDSISDYGFISSVIDCIKESQIPIVCICDNRYDLSIRNILNYCFDIKMTKPAYQDVYRLVYNIVINEKIKIKEFEIKDLYEKSNGDIRFILNSLQLNTKKYDKYKNIQSSNIFETTANIFNIDNDIENKYHIYWLNNDLHTLMVHENYINNTFNVNNDLKKVENITYSADSLSDVDLLENYVNMTNWEFEPYVAFNTVKATMKCNKKTLIRFPQFLGKTSAMYKNKKEKLNYENTYTLNNLNISNSKQKTTVKKISDKPKKLNKPKT